MAESDSPTPLDRARAHFQTILHGRELEGDGSVFVYRVRTPWSLDQIGPSLLDGRGLLALERAVLDESRQLRDLTDKGEPVRWVHDRSALEALFFDQLADSHGAPWSDFLKAVGAAWDAKDELPEASSTEAPVNAVDLVLNRRPLRRLSSEAHFVAQTLQVAGTVAADACNGSWRDAFASGRILVFELGPGFAALRPPHLWETAAPFRCSTLTDLENRRSAEMAKLAREREAAARERRRRGEQTLLDDLTGAGICPAWVHGKGLSSGLFEARSVKRWPNDGRKFAFLLSGQLPHRLRPNFKPAPRAPVEPPKPRGRPSRSERDADLIREAWEELCDGTHATCHDAARAIFERYPDRCSPNTEYQSNISWLHRELKALEKKDREKSARDKSLP